MLDNFLVKILELLFFAWMGCLAVVAGLIVYGAWIQIRALWDRLL